MAKPVVFVIGCSGQVGSATIRALSAKYAYKLDIRAGTRNPASDKAVELKLPGVTLVQAEMGSETLTETLKGVDALYIVPPGGTDKRPELAIRTAESAKNAGVKFVLFASDFAACVLPDTIIGKQYTQIETRLSEIGIPYCSLRLPFFIDNFRRWGFKKALQQQSSIISPLNPEKPFAAVLVEDLGKAAAVILAEPSKHAGKIYRIVSDRFSYNDITRAFSEALGKQLKYVKVSYDDTKRHLLHHGFPEWEADAILEIEKLIDSDCPVTDANQADMSLYKAITGEDPTTLRAWLAKVEHDFK